jgi:hypothetical protein
MLDVRICVDDLEVRLAVCDGESLRVAYGVVSVHPLRRDEHFLLRRHSCL